MNKIYNLVLIGVLWLVAAMHITQGGVQCPQNCVCEVAKLKTAPFVLRWMTSWGEDDVVQVHPNDVLNADDLLDSGTAAHAQVAVDQEGLHTTCSLHPGTNLTQLLSSIAPSTMVLSILQAPGCDLSFIDGGDLSNLKNLTALYLEGYAHRLKQQVSGFTPNGVADIVMHSKRLQQEFLSDGYDSQELRLALAEDALEPLKDLLLLDMQYVRLAASKDKRRPRRHSTADPLTTTSLLDLPLNKFLELAQKIDSFSLPPHLRQLAKKAVGSLQDVEQDEHSNQKFKFIFKDKYSPNDIQQIDTSGTLTDLVEPDIKISLLSTENPLDLVPYEVFKAETEPELAPFELLSKLKYLRVANARLDRIGQELLAGLSNVHTLTLEHNNINYLPPRLFESTPSLVHLSVAHNKIRNLNSESFTSLDHLLTLDLDGNEIAMIGPASLPYLPSLATLRLKDNPLKVILPDAFLSVNRTENIYIGSHNVSMNIHVDAFRLLGMLDVLVIENATFGDLQKELLWGMPSLQELVIHGYIEDVDYDAFSGTTHLQLLDLSWCHLKWVSMDAFFGLKELKVLNLSHNELSSLSPGTFDHLTSLKELYLNENKLSVVPVGIFLPIPVELIQLQNNPWHCTCELLQLRPSITNKVRQKGYLTCQWSEKLGTTCMQSKDRLVYDARVAPLCMEPEELRGHDVFHATLRHLKCDKAYWDPRMLLNISERETSPTIRVKASPEDLEELEMLSEENNESHPPWLPLTAFTPEPIHQKDLLEVAEQEGLEEVTDTNNSSDKEGSVQKQKGKTSQNLPISPMSSEDISEDADSSDAEFLAPLRQRIISRSFLNSHGPRVKKKKPKLPQQGIKTSKVTSTASRKGHRILGSSPNSPQNDQPMTSEQKLVEKIVLKAKYRKEKMREEKERIIKEEKLKNDLRVINNRKEEKARIKELIAKQLALQRDKKKTEWEVTMQQKLEKKEFF